LPRDLPLVTISPGSGDSHEDRVMYLVFDEFDTLGSYVAENIKKSEESFSSPAPEATRPGFSVERKVPCHTTNTKEMLSFLDGNQILLIVGQIPRTRIPRSAIPFPAIRILRCLRPNLSEIANSL
jgi:hypothetical protein